MDAHGHHNIANVGEKVLKVALKAANPKRETMRIGAFYLGNWLTDMSQCVDPAAYKRAEGKVAAFVHQMHDFFVRMIEDVPTWIVQVDPFGVVSSVRARLDEAEVYVAGGRLPNGTAVKGCLQVLLDAGRDSSLAHAFQKLFYFMGYFKFVLSADGKSTPDMEPDVFKAIFKQRYTQYYPHEHLDRPEIKTGVYDQEPAYRPINRFTKSTPSDTDLYKFLRDHTTIAAGLLAEVDHGIAKGPDHVSWARGSFHPGLDHFHDADGKKQPVDDKNVAWNLYLAKLGHAFHATEDFFAHSTFVDHASKALPATYHQVQRWSENETLLRRLKKWQPNLDESSWNTLPNDPRVVTGYFDFQDTLLSLGHLLMDALGSPEPHSKRIDDVIGYDYGKLMRDTLELCDDFKKVWSDPRNDPGERGYSEKEGNAAVKFLREKGDKGLERLEGKDERTNKIITLLLDHSKLKDLPPDVRDAYRDAAQGFLKVVGAAQLGITLYGALKTVVDVLTNPLAFLKDWLPDFVWKHLKEAGELYMRNLIAEYLGSKRIGCHSLIAKDTEDKLLSDASNECAQAVHWYLMTTLARHGRDKAMVAPRGTGGDDQSRLVLLCQEWIDWLELVEYFLSHPFAAAEVKAQDREIAVSIQHITTEEVKHGKVVSKMSPDSLKNLADKYGKTFKAVPGGPTKLTWEVIADWNFPTKGLSTAQRQRQINQYLKDKAEGLLVRDKRNYAFKPGLKLTIPYQKAVVPAVTVPAGERRWWWHVITEGHDVLIAWYSRRRLESAPNNLHRPICVDPKEVEDLVKQSQDMRKAFEKKYDS